MSSKSRCRHFKAIYGSVLLLIFFISCKNTPGTTTSVDRAVSPSMYLIQLAVFKTDSSYTVRLTDQIKIEGKFLERFNTKKPNGWQVQVRNADLAVFSASVDDPISQGIEIFTEEGTIEKIPVKEGIISFRMPGDLKFTSLNILNEKGELIANIII